MRQVYIINFLLIHDIIADFTKKNTKNDCNFVFVMLYYNRGKLVYFIKIYTKESTP